MFYDKTMQGATYAVSQAPAVAIEAFSLAEVPTLENWRWTPTVSLPKGTWFDEGLDLREPEGDAFTRHILDMMAPFEGLKIRRSQIKTEHRYTRVRKLLANALRCFYYFDPALVAYFRGGGRFKDKPAWFSGTGMRANTDALKAAGLVDITPGRTGSASTYEATEALLFAALDFGVTEKSLIFNLPRTRLIRMYKTNRDGPYAEFDQTEETQKWTAQLETFNGFLDQQDIDLALTFAEQARIVAGWNYGRESDKPQYHMPELFRTHLFRQFNNGSWEEGGRLYGGWWMGIPERLRSRITINDQPTVELDYSGCAIRMLYHLRGLECPDDPYHLEEIAAFERMKGHRPGHFREAIKALTQARINGTNRDKDMMCDLPGGVTFVPHFKRDEVTAMIEVKHKQIADAFGSGAGVRLQRMDSDLALSVVTGLMEKGIVALPIHDSFVVEANYKGQLFQVMKDSYKAEFAYDPVIK